MSKILVILYLLEGGFVVAISNTGGGVYSITTDNCTGVVLAVNDKCTVNIQCLDFGVAGTKVGVATISDTGAVPVLLNLTGTK